MLKRALLFGLVACLFSPERAAAETYRGVGFAGGTVGANDVAAYAGAVIALPGGDLGRGFAVRASLNGGEYDYFANSGRVEADYRGAEAALVYQTSGNWGWANVSAGPRLTTLKLSPNDPANDRLGKHVDLGLQLDGGLNLQKWRLHWLSSIAVANRAYLTQLALGHEIKGRRDTRLGAEAGLHGDKRYTKVSAGSFASTRLGRNVEGRVAAGLSFQKDRDLQPYLSAGTTILW